MSEPTFFAEVRGPYGGWRRWRVFLVGVLRDHRAESYVGSYWTRGGARYVAQATLQPHDPERPRIVERVEGARQPEKVERGETINRERMLGQGDEEYRGRRPGIEPARMPPPPPPPPKPRPGSIRSG
jgi:hypothetical protein